MTHTTKFKSLLFILLLAFLSINTWADNFHYRADVKGMVCAFCVYSVGKKIRQLPGVDADSVDVSLKNKRVKFSSQKKVTEKKLTALFKKSGFSLSNLTVTSTSKKKSKSTKRVRMDLKVDVFETDQFTLLLKAIGDIAAKTPSYLRIVAPQEQEETILKAILMGRKQIIQVFFTADESSDTMHLQLFSAK